MSDVLPPLPAAPNRQDRKDAVIAAYQQSDATIPAIARAYGVHTATVHRWAREENLSRPTGRRAIPAKVKTAVVADAKKAEAPTLSELAEKHQISATSVSRILREANIALPETLPSDATRRAVIEAYEANHETVTQIAERFGVSTATVTTWARRAGLQRRRIRTRPTRRQERVLEAYRTSGLPRDEIARRYRLSPTTLARWIERFDAERQTPLRDPHEATRASALRAYEETDATMQEIADEHGIALVTLAGWAREAGLSRSRKQRERVARITPDILRAYVTTTLTVKELAERFEVHPSTITRITRAHDLTHDDRPKPHRHREEE